MLPKNRIRPLREEKQMLQRQFAVALEIDTPMYNKIEYGEIFLPYTEKLYPVHGHGGSLIFKYGKHE
jgi:transcriptional regulator with XRE-family HTH domain